VPLEKQSSRMFHFVFKMFTVGAAVLHKWGMQAVANQLGEKAQQLGVNIQCG
jgi:phytoene dehydrogenase-like protein